MSQVQAENTIRSLQQTGTSVQKLFTQLPGFVEAQLTEIQNNANKIADQEAAIAANEDNIKTAVRNSAAEIRLQVKEDADKVLDELLGQRGLITTTEADVQALEQRARTAEAEAAKQVDTAVKAAQAALHADYKGQLAKLTSDNAVAIAEYKANAKADQAQIDSLTGQVAQLRKDIEAERNARITIAEHESKAAGVTINQGK